jgi:ABC-2 type transport system ATP-binding protein
MGSFLDEHMLLGYLTPDEYFQTLRKIHHISEANLRGHLDKFTELFNGEILERKKYIRDLSKGNLKKVGIAAAMIGGPEVVMLDEPFENLDPSSQMRLKKLILQEKKQSGTTFLISSHDLNHVTEICDRIVLLEKGKIIKDLNDKEGMAEELNAYFGT